MKGGPIGLKTSGSVAKIAMDIWLREYRKRLEKTRFKVWLLQKYIDDVVFVCSMAKRGHMLVNGILEKDCDTFSEESRNLRRVQNNPRFTSSYSQSNISLPSVHRKSLIWGALISSTR